MKLSDLPKISEKSQKRIGRGHGSGRGGHTSTRGTKGQRSRGDKIGLFFEGTKFKKSLLKRLPLLRGKGKFNPFKPAPVIVNLKYLNLFREKEEVTLESLKMKGILSKDLPQNVQVKILGDGEIKIPLAVLLPTSKQAKEKIEKVGGRVIGKFEVGNVKLEREKTENKETVEKEAKKRTPKKSDKKIVKKRVEEK